MTIINQTVNDYIKLYKNIRCIHLLYIVLILSSITLFLFGIFQKLNIDRVFHQYSRSVVNDFICPIQENKWIVVTTIFYPTPAIYKFLNLTYSLEFNCHW